MIIQALEDHLSAEGFQLRDLSELVVRLLDYQIICRNESQTETTLYDRFVRLERLVADYLSVMGIRLLHNEQFQYVRAYPPGAEIPGLADEIDQPLNTGLRSRLSQQEVAAILALRTQYDKALCEGKIDDNGCVTLSVEALGIALRNLMHRSMPENLTERRNLFRRLRQLRLIQYAADEAWDSNESWFRIRPQIMSFVSESALDALRHGVSFEKDDASQGAVETSESETSPSLSV